MIAPMLVAVPLVAAQLAAGSVSARPPECAPLEAPSAVNVWERAKSPELRRYCDLLASAAAKLAGGRADESREALAIADEAAKTLADRATPLVLRGRALERLRRFPEAVVAFKEARAKDERALDDPAALLAWARALARTGDPGDADAAYRALLPRAATLPPAERASAAIEAALLFESRGPKSLDEATALLRQARRDAQDAMQSLAVVALALTLDRAGEREEARATLATAGKLDVRALLADARVRDVLADAAALPESDALAAIALEVHDPAGAREAWTRYATAAAKGPWADHARARASLAPRGRHAP